MSEEKEGEREKLKEEVLDYQTSLHQLPTHKLCHRDSATGILSSQYSLTSCHLSRICVYSEPSPIFHPFPLFFPMPRGRTDY